MQARLYIDEDAMDDDLVQALRLRGADVQTALDAGLVGRPDEEHLAHAAEAGRVLYTFNVGDFMQLHGEYMSAGRAHAGIIFGDQQHTSVRAAEAEAKKVNAEGTSVGTSAAMWVGQPHFYKKGRLVVLYVGDNVSVLKALSSVLGPQFAGK